MDKKEMIKRLQEHLGVQAKYLGVPSFSYQITSNEKVYTISRDGSITDVTGTTLSFEEILIMEKGKEEDRVAIVDSVGKHETTSEHIGFELVLPLKNHNGVSMRNIINMIYSRQATIMKIFHCEEVIITETFVDYINQKKMQSKAVFFEGLIETSKDSYAGLSFNQEEDTITFNFFNRMGDDLARDAFMHLMLGICKTAKDLKHTTFQVTQTDNEKYSFRTWLIRLGLNGDEFKTTRKVLLSELSGDSAFRTPKEAN